jgi:ATP-dependent DNA helicase RecQ
MGQTIASTPSPLVIPPSRQEEAVREAAGRLGIAELRPSQTRAIDASLAGRDVLMVLPTGFGKSVCYQIPSMLLRRPVVVVSPLRALLRDQQVKLDRREIPCVRLDGTLRGRKRRDALERVAAGEPVLVMTTPETLESDDVHPLLAQTGIGLAAVDEAHCISEWGHDFRPSYSRIGAMLKKLGSPPVLALTATATPRVRSTIVSSLGMREHALVAASPHRSNLSFEVIRCEGDERLRALIRLMKRLRRPGIIYCATRRETDGVHALLRRFGVPAYRYHGKMTATERDAQQKRFMRPRHRGIMVATNAFGLGIDKRDIRYILHYQAPASLEQYVQEAGRAGRDGRKANCILMADPKDRSIHEALLARSRVRPDQLYRLGRALGAWAGEGRSPSLEALAVSAELGPRVVAALLVKLEEAGLVVREEDRIRIAVAPDAIEEEARGLAGQFETLRTQDNRRLDALGVYARTTDCRASFLRAYFGEEDAEPCELCDNCEQRKPRSAGFFAPLRAPEPKQKKKKTKRKRRRAGEARRKTKRKPRRPRGRSRARRKSRD